MTLNPNTLPMQSAPLDRNRVYYFFRRPERCIYGRYIGSFAPGWLEVHPLNSNDNPTAIALNLCMRIKPEEPFIEDMCRTDANIIVETDGTPAFTFQPTPNPWPKLDIGTSYRFDRECEFRRSERGVVVAVETPAPGWVQLRTPSLVPPFYEITWINLKQCFQIVPDPEILTVMKNIRVGDDVAKRFKDRPDSDTLVEGEAYVLHLTREASVEGVLLWTPKPGWLCVSPDGIAKNSYLFNLDLCYMIEPIV